VEELIQIQVYFEFGVVGQRSAQTALEVVKLLCWGDARHRQVNLALLALWSEYLLKVGADLRVGQLGLEVALTIESRRFDETFWFVVADF